MPRLMDYAQSVRFDPVNLDNSNAGTRALGSAFGKIGTSLFRTAQKATDVSAAEQGRASGANLDQNSSSSDFTQAGQAFQKAYNSARLASVQMTAKHQFGQLADQFIANPEDLDGQSLMDFNDQADTIRSSLVNSLPADMRPGGGELLKSYQYNTQSSLAKVVHKVSQNRDANAYYNVKNQQLDEIKTAFAKGNIQAGSQLTGVLVGQINSLAGIGALTPTQAESQRQSVLKSSLASHYIGGAYNALAAHKLPQYTQSFVSSNHPDLTPMEKQALTAKMLVIAQQQEHLNKINELGMQSDEDTALTMIKNGASPSQIAPIEAKLQKFAPGAYQKFQVKKQLAQFDGNINQAFYSMSPVQFSNYLAAQNPAPDDPNYTAKVQVIQTTRNKYNARYHEFQKDPMAAIQNDPGLQQVQIDGTDAPTVNGQGVNVVSALPNNVAQYAIAKQTAMGLPSDKQKLWTNQEAYSESEKLAALPLSQQVSHLEEFKKSARQYWPIYQRQLINNGYGLASGVVMNLVETSPNPGVSMDVYKAFMQTPADLNKALTAQGIKPTGIDTAVNSSLSQLHATLLNNNNFTATDWNTGVETVVKHYALGLLASGKAGTVSAAATMAANQLFNDSFTYMSYRGYSLRIPKKYAHLMLPPQDARLFSASGDEWVQGTQQMLDTLQKQPLFVPAPRVAEAKAAGFTTDTQVAHFSKIEEGQTHWVNTPNNQGLILVGPYGQTVKNAQHEPIKVTWKQMNGEYHAENAKQLGELISTGLGTIGVHY